MEMGDFKAEQCFLEIKKINHYKNRKRIKKPIKQHLIQF
jgi:hypothetical protein